MTAKRARRRKLAELMPDHVLGDEHRHVRLAVVNADRVTDHRRYDRGRAAPRLDDALFAPLVHAFDLSDQMLGDERALLEAAAHYFDPLLRTIMLRVRLLRRVFLPMVI